MNLSANIEKLCLLFTFIVTYYCDCAKILVITSVSSRSQDILGRELAKTLTDAGHEVTYVTGFESGVYIPKNKNGSYREIFLTGMEEESDEMLKSINPFERANANPVVGLIAFMKMCTVTSEKTLKHPKMQELIKLKPKYDAVLVGQLAFEALKPLAGHFGAHLIIYTSTAPFFMSNYASGNSLSPVYDISMFLGYSQDYSKLNLWQRTTNFLMYYLQYAVLKLYVHPVHNKMVKKYISEELDLNDFLHNQSLVLINSHHSVIQAEPLVPQMKFIGGYHVKPSKPLPKDLKEYLDNSTNGAIYFSMGSVLRGSDIHIEKRNAILRVFSGLKQNVIWKFEEDDLPGKPENVKIAKWLPQTDILSHPNVKLFITHCGYGGFIESLNKGKPIVAIPVFGDQPLNALEANELGVGVTLPYNELNEESFSSAIHEVLNNPRYTENVKYRQSVYNDRQHSPTDEAVYWVEYVIRHNGAKHLKVQYLELPWYKYYLIDVLIYITFVIFMSLYFVKIILRMLYSKIPINSKIKTS